MTYTEEIFEILSRGKFISNDSSEIKVRRYFESIYEDFNQYYDYFKGIGFYIEAGDGYYFFTRKETKVDLERKIKSLHKWIDYVSFLKTYDITFGPGFVFYESDLLNKLNIHLDLLLSNKNIIEKK